MTDPPIRILIAKPGLDGHDRGAKVLARGLRDEGFEVIYTGLRQTPEMIADAAEQEDVDVVGLSILSGAHMALLPRTVQLLRDRGMSDVLVAAGGIIPDADVTKLKAAGVAEIFGPGTSIGQIARYFRENARRRGRPVACHDTKSERGQLPSRRLRQVQSATMEPALPRAWSHPMQRRADVPTRRIRPESAGRSLGC